MRLFCRALFLAPALFLTSVAHLPLPAQSTAFVVVSAASYEPVVAPDGLATIFGANLARSSASATLDANGQLPTELAATRVEIDGQGAALFYVSPTQINFVIPRGSATGTVSAVVRSTDIGTTNSASVEVRSTAAAIFHFRRNRKRAGRDLERRDLRGRALPGGDFGKRRR
jgi:uncharacterized protein (TIGR03437 family)